MEGYLNVKDYGAAGNGTNDDTKAIANAISAAIASNTGSTPKTAGILFPPGRYRLGTGLEFPISLTVALTDQAMLEPDPGVTVSMLSQISAGLYPIFGGEGQVVGPMDVPEIYPQWFGASGSRNSVMGAIGKNANQLKLQSKLDFRNGEYVSIPDAAPCRAAAPAKLQAAIKGQAGKTVYNYIVVALDDTGGISAPATIAVNNAPAVITPLNAVVLSWAAAANAAAYAIYGRTAGSAKLLARVQNTTWTDSGAGIRSDAPAIPAQLPALGSLVARIVGGGGTTELTLSASSSVAVNKFIEHDDTWPIKRALAAAGAAGKLAFSPGNYPIWDTLVVQAAALSGAGAVNLLFKPYAPYDLKPCLEISSANTVLSGINVGSGREIYSLNTPTWADPSLFGGQYYDMFVTGSSGIRIAGSARPSFHEVRTSSLKVGVLLDNDVGHVYFYNCMLSGLVGVYCSRNTGDYYFESCDITGVFSGLMLGVKSVSNHSGGFGAQLHRVHMGFSPYSIYQVIDDADLYASVNSVLGLSCIFNTVQHEQVGEAAIKLLPKSESNIIVTGGFGLSWSAYLYSNPRQGWQFALPDTLLPAAQRQQYAVWLGTLGTSDISRGSVTGNLFSSSAPGALGAARIEKLTATSDLEGLSLDYSTIVSKEPYVERSLNSATLLQDRTLRAFNPVGRGNLLQNPESPSSYKVVGGTLTVSAASPVPLPGLFREELGPVPVILQFVPAANAALCQLQINLATASYPSTSIPLSLSLWAYSASQSGINVRLNATGTTSTAAAVEKRAYYNQTVYVRGSWSKITGIDNTPTDQSVSYSQVSLELPRDRPTYFAGLMLSEGPLAAYSPRYHIAADSDVELVRPGNGVILTSPGGKRFRLTINDQGQISISPLT
ncbi:glycosyl hydrolase family 28-related protein [Cohnella sp. GCM10012308]|uniref:glycosyl hydrolase family 28-related protein n=1 Tax=Cohnella sp. GCM10012308 TaxID=3317329 RepID=UPI0036165B17